MSEQNEIPWQEGQPVISQTGVTQTPGTTGLVPEGKREIRINMEDVYTIKGGAVVAIADILKDEIPARFFQTILKVESLLSTVSPLDKTK